MLDIIEGNILRCNENIICHQVNCKGVMGAGLAKQIKNTYPFVYEEYKNLCMIKSLQELIGYSQIIEISKDKYIANLFAQVNYGRNECHTNYAALQRSLQYTFNYAKNNNLSIAVPYKIGCGLAGGDWNIVYNLIEKLSNEYKEIQISIYKYSFPSI